MDAMEYLNEKQLTCEEFFDVFYKTHPVYVINHDKGYPVCRRYIYGRRAAVNWMRQMYQIDRRNVSRRLKK